MSWWICFSFCLLKMLTDGLEWCGLLVDYCDVFISCLDSHSDGTHSLQSIHCWDSDAMLHFSKKQTHLHLGWPEDELFSANFHFFVNYPFKAKIQSLPACAKHFFKLRLLLLFVSLAISQQCALSSCKGLKTLNVPFVVYNNAERRL